VPTPQSLGEILGQLGLADTPENRQIVAALITQGLPLDQQHVQLLSSLQGNPELAAILLGLGIELSDDILAQILDLGQATTASGQVLKEVLELLQQVLVTRILDSDSTKMVESLIAQIRQTVMIAETGATDLQIKDFLALLVSATAGATAESVSGAVQTSLDTFLLSLSDNLNDISVLLGREMLSGTVRDTLLKRLSESRQHISSTAMGQILMRTFHQAASSRESSLVFFPLLWHEEPGTLTIAFDHEREKGKDSEGGKRGESSFLIAFQSLGRIRGHVRVERTDVVCDLGVESEETQKLIVKSRSDLFRACEQAGLDLKQFECFIVPSDRCEAFFSPFALHPDIQEPIPERVLRIDLLA